MCVFVCLCASFYMHVCPCCVRHTAWSLLEPGCLPDSPPPIKMPFSHQRGCMFCRWQDVYSKAVELLRRYQEGEGVQEETSLETCQQIIGCTMS